MEKFEEYRESDIHWLSEIPKSWKTKRLALNGEFYKGKGISKNQLSIEGEDVVLYGDIYTRYDLSTKKFERKAPLEVVDYSFELKYNDLLFTASGETKEDIGKALAFTGSETSYAGGDVIVYRQNKIDAKYLSYLFNSYKIREKKAKESKGEIVVHIYSSQLKDIKFPIPDGKTRKKILAYLDKKTAQIDRIITAKEKLIKLYEEEKTAIINKAVTQGIDDTVELVDSGIDWLGMIPFNWQIKRFKYYFELINQKNQEVNLKVGLENIESNTGKYIKSDSEFQGVGIDFIEDDILFGKLRPYLAKVYLAEFKGQAVGDFYVFRSFKGINSSFASRRLLSESFIDVVNSSSYGSKMPRASWEFISNLPIAFPIIDEQNKITEYLNAIDMDYDSKINKAKKLIKLLTEYRTTLINDVVTGKIKII